MQTNEYIITFKCLGTVCADGFLDGHLIAIRDNQLDVLKQMAIEKNIIIYHKQFGPNYNVSNNVLTDLLAIDIKKQLITLIIKYKLNCLYRFILI